MNSLRLYGDDYGIIVKRVRNGFIIETMDFDENINDYKKVLAVIEQDMSDPLGDKKAMSQVIYAMLAHFEIDDVDVNLKVGEK